MATACATIPQNKIEAKQVSRPAQAGHAHIAVVLDIIIKDVEISSHLPRNIAQGVTRPCGNSIDHWENNLIFAKYVQYSAGISAACSAAFQD